MTIGDSVSTGVGSNKKLAKRVAAEQMLLMLGYSLTPPPPAKPALKTSTDGLNDSSDTAAAVHPPGPGGDKHVTFAERDAATRTYAMHTTSCVEDWITFLELRLSFAFAPCSFSVAALIVCNSIPFIALPLPLLSVAFLKLTASSRPSSPP